VIELFALGQTTDPVRDFFLPFSSPKRRRSATFRGAYAGAAKAPAVERAEERSVSVWIPEAIVILLIHVVVDAIMFSVVAGVGFEPFEFSPRNNRSSDQFEQRPSKFTPEASSSSAAEP
jgi:hypothetical protein